MAIKLFSETRKLDEERTISVSILPDGITEIRTVYIKDIEYKITKMALSKEAILELNEMLTALISTYD